MDFAESLFSHICHQQGDRAWVIGGVTLALCARCTGVYAGAALGAVALPLARFKPTSAVLWAHGVAMIQVAIFGFHLLGDQPAWVRTLSGSLFAAGTIYFLFLAIRSKLWPTGKGAVWAYLAAAAGAQVALQVLVRLNTAWGAAVVGLLALAGLAVITILAFASMTIVASALFGRRRPT